MNGFEEAKTVPVAPRRDWAAPVLDGSVLPLMARLVFSIVKNGLDPNGRPWAGGAIVVPDAIIWVLVLGADVGHPDK